jgi:hypothetical protein
MGLPLWAVALALALESGGQRVVIQNSGVTVRASRFRASEHPRVILFLLGVPRLESLTQLTVYRDFVARCISLGYILDLSMREHLADVKVDEALVCRLCGVAKSEEILSHVAFNYGAIVAANMPPSVPASSPRVGLQRHCGHPARLGTSTNRMFGS